MWGAVKVAEMYWKMLLNFKSYTTEAAGHEATRMTENLKIHSKIYKCNIPNWVAVNVAVNKVEAYVLFTCIYSEKKITYMYFTYLCHKYTFTKKVEDKVEE